MKNKHKKIASAIAAIVLTINAMTGSAFAATGNSFENADKISNGSGTKVSHSKTLTLGSSTKAKGDSSKTFLEESSSEIASDNVSKDANNSLNAKPKNPLDVEKGLYNAINGGASSTYIKDNSKTYIDADAGRGVRVTEVPKSVVEQLKGDGIDIATSELNNSDMTKLKDVIAGNVEGVTPTIVDILQFYSQNPGYVNYTAYGEKKLPALTSIYGVSDTISNLSALMRYGYSPEFNGVGDANKPIANVEGGLTEETQKKIANEGFVYKNLFNTDDAGLLEDASILIRKVLGTNPNDFDADLTKVEKAADADRNETERIDKWYEDWAKSAAGTIEDYLRKRTDATIGEVMDALIAEDKRHDAKKEELDEREKTVQEAMNAAIAAHNKACGEAAAAGQPIPSAPNLSGYINELVAIGNERALEETRHTEEVERIQDTNGDFQKAAKNDYNNSHSENYQKFLVCVKLLDEEPYASNYTFGSINGETDVAYSCGEHSGVVPHGLSESEIEKEEENDIITSADDLETFFWARWIATGETELPKTDEPLNSQEQLLQLVGVPALSFLANPDDAVPYALEFRDWLIKHGLYFGPEESSSKYWKYTFGPQNSSEDLCSSFSEAFNNWVLIYKQQNILTYFYGEKGGHYTALEEDYSEYKNITNDSDAIDGAVKMNKDYPYLEGYANSSFLPTYDESYKNAANTTDTFLNFVDALGLIDGDNTEHRIDLKYYTDVTVTDYVVGDSTKYQDQNYQRFEWYVYYNPDKKGRKDNASVVFHSTTTSPNCPFTATAPGRYWVDCYQSSKISYGEHLEYMVRNFLVDDFTKTVFYSTMSDGNVAKIDEMLLAEKTLLPSEKEDGFVLEGDAQANWRAKDKRIIATFNTERVNDDYTQQ